MIDVRGTLERESRFLRWRTVLTVAFVLVWGAYLGWVGLHRLRSGLTVGNLIGAVAPLAALSTVAVAYSDRHRKALEAAIENPDPSLDPYFAAALDADEDDVARLARTAFLRRFSERSPVLDDLGWQSVAHTLPNSAPEAFDRLLALLRQGAPPSAIPVLEAFANATESERGRTAALFALGEIRQRNAQERILKAEDDLARLRG